MSNSGIRRRSLLANAIDSLGTSAPATEAEAASPALPAAAEPVREEQAAPSFLERRGAAMDEIARTVKRPTIRIRPNECTIWPGNARDYAGLSYERCASLIESIKEENGNREPVVIRRTPDGAKPYELIVGTRRHFSVSWLRDNQHGQMDLIARIETLDDEGAFRLADIENREREDVTDLERARNYLHAVETYYNGVRAQMAERLAISKQYLHNLLQLAELPDEIIAAFASPSDLKVSYGMKLSPLAKSPDQREGLLAAAVAIGQEQEERRARGGTPIEGAQVFHQLVAQARPRPERAATARSRPTFHAPCGAAIGQVLSDSKTKGLTITINPKSAVDVEEILSSLRTLLEGAKFSRR